MITSKRVLAAGFVAALGLAGLGLGASNAGASADMMGGGLCDGIDLSTLTGGAAAGSAASGSEAPMATAAATGTEAAGSAAAGEGGTNVAVLFDVTGRGDKSFNDAAAAGLDQAVAEFGVDPTESTPSSDGDRAERLSAAIADGNDLVIAVGYLWGNALTEAAAAAPDTHFGIVDSVVDSPNVASLLFAEHQGSFLVGVAAALKTKTDHVGFVGGVPNALIQKFQAGFEAGVACVNPDITVEVQYVNDDPTSSGSTTRPAARSSRAAMYEAGADVVYAAAGGPARACSRRRRGGRSGDVWTIGVDSDHYQQVDPDLQPYVLTSMLKRVDVATYETIRAEVEGSFAGGDAVRPVGRRRRLLDVGRLRRRHRPGARRPEGPHHRRHDRRPDETRQLNDAGPSPGRFTEGAAHPSGRPRRVRDEGRRSAHRARSATTRRDEP